MFAQEASCIALYPLGVRLHMSLNLTQCILFFSMQDLEGGGRDGSLERSGAIEIKTEVSICFTVR